MDNKILKSKYKILIDCTQVNSEPRGMGLYSLDLAKSFLNNEDCLFIFGHGSKNQEFFQSLKPKGKLISFKAPQVLIEQFIIPFVILFYSVKTYISAGNSVSIIGSRLCNTKLIVHDIYFTKKVDLKTLSLKRILGRLYRRISVGLSINKVRKIVTVSNFTKKEIITYYPNVDLENISVIPNMLRFKAEKCIKKTKKVLMVTGTDPQKNANWAINTLLTLDVDIDEILVIGVKSAKDLKLQNHVKVKYFGFLAQNDLEAFYKECFLIIIPSLNESFGVPVIEALAKNCFVCASNTGALPETGNRFAKYFKLDDKNSFKEALLKSFEIKHDWPSLCDYLKNFSRSKIETLYRGLID